MFFHEYWDHHDNLFWLLEWEKASLDFRIDREPLLDWGLFHFYKVHYR